MNYVIIAKVVIAGRRRYSEAYLGQTYRRHEPLLHEMIQLYQNEMKTFEQIGEALGVPWWDVKRLLREYGVQAVDRASRARYEREKDFQAVYRMHYEQKMTFGEIGQVLRRSSPYIRRVLTEHGCTPVNYGQAQFREKRH